MSVRRYSKRDALAWWYGRPEPPDGAIGAPLHGVTGLVYLAPRRQVWLGWPRWLSHLRSHGQLASACIGDHGGLPRRVEENGNDLSRVTVGSGAAGDWYGLSEPESRVEEMYYDDHSRESLTAGTLLAADRRPDGRRRSQATVWLLDEGLDRAVEFASVRDISRSGVCLDIAPRLWHETTDPKVGMEWLVIVDDPTMAEPLAQQRPMLIIARRVERLPDGHWRIGCETAARRIGRCVWTDRLRQKRQAIDIERSDLVDNNVLDALVERIGRDMVADETFGQG